MNKSLKLLVTFLVLLAVIVVGVILLRPVTIESQLFPKPVQDTFPEDTLQIPKDQWETKSEALALRALKYFEAKGIVSKPLPRDQVKYRKGVIVSWGKPWRLHFLKNNLNQKELQMVWDEELSILADTPEELAQVEVLNEKKLARVKPTVEVDKDKFTGYYETYADIQKAYKSGVLGKVSLKHVKSGDNLYVVTKLVDAVSEIDKALGQSDGIYEVSSATRAIKLQELLRKLGYPAAQASFHNLGKAIDFKLTMDASKRLGKFFNKKMSDGKTRMEKIDAMIQSGTYPTMKTLIANQILPEDYELVKAYKTLTSKAGEVGVQVYDETPFFVTFSEKDNRVVWVSPVLHLQLKD